MKRLQCWMAVVLTVGALAVEGAGLRAQDPKKTADANTYNTLKEVINHGADLYNGGDWNGCYRLYEGALITLKPFLEHRPELQKAIDDGIAASRRNAALDRRAFDLRGIIDKIRAETRPGGPVKPPVAMKLWDRLGGDTNVKKVVDDFVAAAAADPKVDFFRGGKNPLDAQGVAKLKKLIVEFISSATEGPYKYTGKSMKEVHKGMAITAAQFDASAKHLEDALKKNGAKAEDIALVMKAVGGTRADLVEGSKPPDPMPTRTLWDRLGGKENVEKVVNDFVAAAAPDPKVDFFRGGKAILDATGVAKLKRLLVEFISSATGGPIKYTGKSMKESHKDMEITDAQFDALAKHLENALKKNGAKTEDISLVMKAVEGTRKEIVEPKKPEPPRPGTHEGIVVKVGGGKLTMTDKDGKNEHTHDVAADTKVSRDGKDGKLDDLKKGDKVKVTTEVKGGKDVVVKIEAKSS